MEKNDLPIQEWDRNPRMPDPPALSCDRQCHIYDDPLTLPARADTARSPVSARHTEEREKNSIDNPALLHEFED